MKYINLIGSWLLVVSCSLYGDNWIQTDWSGGSGQLFWSDTTKYYESSNMRVFLLPSQLALRDTIEWNDVATFPNTNKVYQLAQYPNGAMYASTGETNAFTFRSVDQWNTWNTLFYYPNWITTRASEFVEGNLYIAMDHLNNISYIVKYTGDTLPISYDNFPTSKLAYDLLYAFDYFFFLGGDDTARVYKGTLGGSWTPSILPGKRALCIIKASNDILYVGTGGTVGKVMKSTNQGGTWKPTDSLPGVISVNTLVEASDGSIYAGTSNGKVFKTTDQGLNWQTTGKLTGADQVFSIICDTLDNLYAGTQGSNGKGIVFKSTNGGTSWINYSELEGTNAVRSLLKLSDTLILAGTGGTLGKIFKGVDKYDSLGWLVSSVYNTGTNNRSVKYDTIYWDADYNGQNIVVKVRSFDDTVTFSDTIPWSNCPPCTNGQYLPSISSVRDSMQFIQYRLEFSTQNLFVSPVFHEIRINYSLDTTGPVINSACVYGDEDFIPPDSIIPKDKVVISFNEPMNTLPISSSNIDSLLKLSANHSWVDSLGNVSANWDTSCKMLIITLGKYGWSGWVNAGDTIYPSDRITDIWGNKCASPCVITGSFGPVIDSIIAYDGADSIEYIDADDYVTLYFSKRTNKPRIDKNNIDSVLCVPTHTWLDGFDELRGDSCIWDTFGFVLICSLKIDSLRPTIIVGDIVYPDSITIWDKFLRGPLVSPCVIRGSFGEYAPIMVSATAYEGWPPDSGVGDGDYVWIAFNKFIDTVAWSSVDIDTVLIPQNNGVVHTWHPESLICFVQQIEQQDQQGIPYTMLYISFQKSGVEEDSRRMTHDPKPESYPNPFLNHTWIEFQLSNYPTIQLSTQTNQSPSIAVGDTIYPNPNVIKDLDGRSATKFVVLQGELKKSDAGCWMQDARCRTHNTRRTTQVSLKIYNLAGQEVRTLVDKSFKSGKYKVLWDGLDDEGKEVKSGVYFYKLKVNGRSFTNKLIKLI